MLCSLPSTGSNKIKEKWDKKKGVKGGGSRGGQGRSVRMERESRQGRVEEEKEKRRNQVWNRVKRGLLGIKK